MKLDRLQLSGFGKFKDFEVGFSPGLNLIHGENESGKSTLQNFIRGMLFSFKKQGTRRSYDELLERYRPWGGGQYYGVLEYTLEGRSYRVERNFNPEEEKVRVLDGGSWEDITAKFSMDKRKEVLFAQEQLGISQVIFDNTICVRQLQNTSASELAGEIQSKLVNLTAAGEEDISIQQALQALDLRLKELGLTERSSKTELGKITGKVEELERARQNTLQVYAEIRSAETKREALAEDLLKFTNLLQNLSMEANAVKVKEIQAKLAKIAEYDRKIEKLQLDLSQLAGLSGFPVNEKDNLLLALERENLARKNTAEIEQKSGMISDSLCFQRQSLAKLLRFAGFNQDSALAVENGFTKLEEAALQAQNLEQKRLELIGRSGLIDKQYSKFAGCVQLGAAGEAEVHRLEEEINGLKLRSWALETERFRLSENSLMQKIKLKTGFALASLAAGIVIGGLLGWLVFWPLGFSGMLGLMLGLWLWSDTRQDKNKLKEIRSRLEDAGYNTDPIEFKLKEKNERLEYLLAAAGVASARELNEKMRQFALVEHSRQTILLELANLEDSLAKLHQRLREEARQLEARFLGPAETIQAGQSITRTHVEEFCSGVNNYLQLKAGERDLLRQEQDIIEQKTRILAEGAAARREVEQILSAAGVSSVEEFLAACESAKTLLELQNSLEALNIARAEALGPLTFAQLQASEEKLAKELAGWRGIEARSPEEVFAALNETNNKIQETKELIANLQGIIETRLNGVKNVAGIEQELVEARQEKEQVINRKKALELARRTILEVSQEVQREFAPAVNNRIGLTISSVTAGRYLASKIDQDLAIKVVVPETGEVKDISNLSLGTVDQFYFALRLALTEVIGARFPLILDEPFVQYDDSRLEAVLRVLLELAAQNQVLLFSCHKRELQLLNKIAPQSYNLISL